MWTDFIPGGRGVVMNFRVLDVVFALLLFYLAYRVFDIHDWTQLGVSTVLFLSGLNSAFRSSESVARRKFGQACLRLAAVMAVFLILKILFL
jgi:Kef-type K+ transport system membrane component KefB